MGLKNIFMGAPQSKYAASAIILALICVSVSILFGKESMPLGQKIGAILLLVLVSVPGVLYSLFQITCLETGAGLRNQRWWCSLYAWLITAVLIVYCVLLIAVAILSVFTSKRLSQDVEKFTDANFTTAVNNATTIAQKSLQGAVTQPPSQPPSQQVAQPVAQAVAQPVVQNPLAGLNNPLGGLNDYLSGGLPVNQFNYNSSAANSANPDKEDYRNYQSGLIIRNTEESQVYPFTAANAGAGWESQ
jgi:hypothetical protein